MARYNNGINGPVKGKIGNVVAVIWRGIHVLRSLPEFSGKMPSTAQLIQRQLMAMVSSFLQPLKLLIEIGFQHFAAGKTAMNAAVSFVMKNAVLRTGDDLQIDYSQVVFSRGELQPSTLVNAEQMHHTLNLNWNNFGATAFSNDDDLLSIIVYCKEVSKYCFFRNCAQRVEQMTSVQLPEEFSGYALHCWLQYVNVTGDMVSTSIYVSPGKADFTTAV